MIDIHNLSFGYHPKKLLYRDLDLKLPTGRIYGLLGRNGAGKSTLLKNLSGLLFPSAGSIQVNGFEPRRRRPDFLQTIYFIPEEVYVPSLTINSYIRLFSPFYSRFNAEQMEFYLQELEVATLEKLSTLSFGQQKKFIISFALACNTRVLILDEPTNGLDIPSKKKFRKLIASVMNEERIILISTHQTRDLDNLIDQVIIVENGRLLLNAPISVLEEKLLFRTQPQVPQDLNILYQEETLQGFPVVAENQHAEHSKVNLENLFNAVMENPEKIMHLITD